MIFDVKPDDVYWCAADIGWVTGHSYIVYGPLANATTGVLYEGSPDTPAWDRWWQIIEDYKVTILYCAPTAIRAFMKQGDAAPGRSTTCRRCASSARSASRSTPRPGSGTTSTSAASRRPIVDTWWQTETGHDPHHAAARRDDDEARVSATFPFPGIEADVVDGDGNSVPLGRRRLPRPEAAVAGDAARHLRRPGALQADLLEPVPGHVLRRRRRQARRGRLLLAARPGRRRDERVRPPASRRSRSSRRWSTTRRSPRRRSSARPTRSPARRSSPSSSSRLGIEPTDGARRASCASTSPRSSGRSPSPKYLLFTPDLPKTRSGKIMRRLLRDIAEGRPLGDTTTLADAGVVETIRENSFGRPRSRPVPFEFPAEEEARRRQPAATPRRGGGAVAGVADAASPSTALTEEWRLVGRMDIDGRLSDSSTSARRSRSHDVQWAPIDGSAPLAPAPGSARRPVRPDPRARRRGHAAAR